VRRWRRALVLAAALVAVALVPATPALAAGDLQVGVEDERLLLDEPDRAADTVAAWQALGISVSRVHARWSRLAPRPDSARKPSGFRASDPDDPRYDWTELDRAVSLLRAAGIKIDLSVTGPGPLWSSGKPSLRNPRYRPKPAEYEAFARAVARRYKGQIQSYLIWNEPNIAGWLDPQFDCARRRGRTVCTPVSPHLYRGLVRAATTAIRSADAGAEILAGELAPKGGPGRSARTTMTPLDFFRAFGCVDGRYRPIRTGLCRGFKPASIDGIGHHPHPVDIAPDEPSGVAGWAKMGDLPRFIRALDRLTAGGRIRTTGGGKLPLHLTEFGYQTSPPDHAIGIPVSRDAVWTQQAEYLAWRNPRVHTFMHYQWEDEPVRYRGPGSLAYAGWQSGLRYVDGRAKPTLSAMAAPLVVDRTRSGAARVWGQVLGGRAKEVTLERDAGGGFKPLVSVATNAFGFWARTVRVGSGDELRFTWRDPARDTTDDSRVARVGGASLAASR
jgi:hypothetical protein